MFKSYLDNPIKTTTKEARAKYKNKAYSLIVGSEIYVDTPQYGKVLYDFNAELIAIADNNEKDIEKFDRLMEIEKERH
jgi:hypothetical protein